MSDEELLRTILEEIDQKILHDLRPDGGYDLAMTMASFATRIEKQLAGRS